VSVVSGMPVCHVSSILLYLLSVVC
jgi:hypothetical protein